MEEKNTKIKSQFPEYRNLVEMFIDQANKSSSKTALKYKKNGIYHTKTYAEFLERVVRLSAALKNFGVRKGEKVCLLSENRPEWFYSDLAILSLGAVTVPIYPTNSPKECVYIIKHADAELLILSTWEHYTLLKTELKDFSGFKKIIVMESGPISDNVTSFEKVLEQFHGDYPALLSSFQNQIKPIQYDDIATIIYTSGTTGDPKGVMLSHGNILSNCWASRNALAFKTSDISLSALPLSHVFERMAGFYLQIYQGTTVAFAENMKTIPQNLIEVKPTTMDAVPRFFEKIQEKTISEIKTRGAFAGMLFNLAVTIGRKNYEVEASGKNPSLILSFLFKLMDMIVYSKIKKQLGGRIRFFVSGGAPLSKELAVFFKCIDIQILEGYGLTETSPVISVNRLKQYRFGSAGLPLENIQIRLGDDDEIQVKGPGVMKGYYKDDAATNEVIKDGWFSTGDIGRFDADGYLYITDRKKDLIKTSGGKFISPQKVEKLLMDNDWIEQAFVYGDKRKFTIALLVPSFQKLEKFAIDHNISAMNRMDLIHNPVILAEYDVRVKDCQKDLADYEKVKYFALLPEELTLEKGDLTPTLKMKRRIVIEKNKDLIEKIYKESEEHGSK